MNKIQNIFWIAIVILSWKCQNTITTSEGQACKLVFGTEFSGNNPDFELKSIAGVADSTGRIFIKLTVLNTSKNKIECNSFDWELETDAGLRSTPVKHDSVISIIPGISIINLEFDPVNSLALYKLTALKGDLGKNYKLTYKSNLLQSTLSFSDEQYTAYKKNWSIEKNMTIYQPDPPSDFADEEETYLSRNINLKNDDERLNHNVHVSEEEILLDGLNTKLSSYQNNDTLYVNLTLINHSPFVVTIDLSSLYVQFENRTGKPLSNRGDTYVEIPRSQRHFTTVKYFLPDLHQQKFVINLSSLKFRTPAVVTIFCKPIMSFEKRDKF